MSQFLMSMLLAQLSLLLVATHGFKWQLGARQPDRPEAEVCGIARDYLLPTHTAYRNLKQLATVNSSTGKVSLK